MREEEAANPAEIEAALRSLSPADLHGLEKFAIWRTRALGRVWHGNDHEDLLAEAVAATLAGDRRWNKHVAFVEHLRGAMRSISSHWSEKKGRGEEQPFALAPDDEQQMRGEEHVPSNEPMPDAEAVAKSRLQEIESLFSSDQDVLEVIDGLRAELTGPEIQELLEISETEYWTRMRRMRRALERHELRGGVRA